MQNKRRIPKDKLLTLLEKDLTVYERGLVSSILRAQKYYPQITPRMYSSFWRVYDKYFLDLGE